jgi:hypothetical protein
MQSPLAADAGQSVALESLVVPEIGQPWPDQGGIYAGIARDDDGTPQHHLILCPAVPAKRLTWKAAKAWVAELVHEGHTDFALPTRRQSALLYATLYDQVEADWWYWTSSEYSERSAWIQDFFNGSQDDNVKSYEARARAVRRLPIDPSILQAAS